MEEYLIMAVAGLVGALSGTIRTYLTHGLKLVQPTFSFRERTINLRLGWLASALLGAIFGVAAVTGLYWVAPMQPPDTIYEAMLIAFPAGYASLEIINRWVGNRFPDLDTEEFGLSLDEINLEKITVIQEALTSLPCIERIQIRDQEVAGVVQVWIVPKQGLDMTDEQCKTLVQNFFSQHRPLGVQIYVELPQIVMVDVSLKAIVLGMSEVDPNQYRYDISTAIRKYIDSLLPGQWVMKQPLISKAIIDRFVKDVPGDSFVTTPAIVDGSHIPIGQFEVARAGEIAVDIEIVAPLNGGGVA